MPSLHIENLLTFCLSIGLKVKEDHYSYAWLQMPSKDMTLSSMSLTEEDENFPHARIYMIDPLKETEMIVEEAVAMADNTHLKLLVIVNDDNSYEIEGLPEQKWRTPVIVVTASTGENLKKHLCKKGVEESVLELVLHMQDEPDYSVPESEIEGICIYSVKTFH